MQNKLLTKAAFILLVATLLQACGGGDGDSTTTTNTLTDSNTPTSPVVTDSSNPKPLSAITELQSNIKNLSTDWPTGVTVGNDNTLTFAGSPKLAKGDIFVVNSTAYKVEGIGGTPSATQVIVSQPALNEVYKKIEISGQSDALEFIPNPELGLQPVAVAPENQGFQLGLGIKPSDAENKLTLSKNSDGFYTVKYSVKKGFNGFSVDGALTVGAKAEVRQWDVISNKGYGKFDIFIEPSLMVSLLKNKNNVIDKSGICSSKSNLRGANYILLGTIPMSKALAAVPVAGAVLTSTVSMNIPVCLSMNASTDMNLDLLQLSGKFQVIMFVGNQQAPHFLNSPGLTVSAPAATATLSEATLYRFRYTAKAEGEMAVEAGLELGDNLNLVNVGATAAAVIEASLEGDFGVSLLYKSLRGVIAEPDACLTLKGKGIIRAKGQTSFFWGKDLSVVQEMPIVNIPDAQFGFCQRTHLTVSPLSDNVSIGSTRQFSAQIVDDQNRPVLIEAKLQWKSSDPTVATVSNTGLVTAIKKGSTKITVTDVTDVTDVANIDEKKSATATVAVDLPIITITPNTPPVSLGSSVQLNATATDLQGNPITTPTLVWASNNTGVTVSNTGLVTAAFTATGEALITAKDSTSGAIDTVIVKLSSYVKISATGEKLPISATEWSCVLDNQTGLMWENKTDDGGLRDQDHRYSWFEDSSGYADMRDYYVPKYSDLRDVKPYGYYCHNTLAKCNTTAYAQAVNTQKLCGYSNWRLGTKEELVALGRKTDKRNFFEGNFSSWSSSPHYNESEYAWFVFFDDVNGDNDGRKEDAAYVRLVRSSQ